MSFDVLKFTLFCCQMRDRGRAPSSLKFHAASQTSVAACVHRSSVTQYLVGTAYINLVLHPSLVLFDPSGKYITDLLPLSL